MLKATFLHARHFAVDQRPTQNKYTTKYKNANRICNKKSKINVCNMEWNKKYLIERTIIIYPFNPCN